MKIPKIEMKDEVKMRGDTKIPGRCYVALVTCMIMLMITAMPPMGSQVFAGTAGSLPGSGESNWSETIPQMLQAGEYQEGVVFAGIDLRRVGSITDVAKDVEEVMTVDASAVEPVQEAAGQEDCVSIVCIQRLGKTTEQMDRTCLWI